MPLAPDLLDLEVVSDPHILSCPIVHEHVPTSVRRGLRLPFSAAPAPPQFCRRVLRCSGTFHTWNMSPHREEVLLRWCPSPGAIASKGGVVDRWTWNT
jgi:hypothetical protein